MDDVAFGVKMQLQPAFLNQRIKQRIFPETTLHPVHLIGNESEAFLLFAYELNQPHEILTVALGGGFHHLKGADHFQPFAVAILLQPMLLGGDGIAFFLLLSGDTRQNHRFSAAFGSVFIQLIYIAFHGLTLPLSVAISSRVW
ncbi:MAG: hypothetical protein SFX19_04385 [Alphaproteobacteria bacterium]|nr:hypothetical protein [Alphaproteobacteria bacterium]